MASQKNEIDFIALSVAELDAIIQQAQTAKEEKKKSEVAKIKAEIEGRLSQFSLSIDDVFPKAQAGAKPAKAKPEKSSATLEEPEKGATYRNPDNQVETWTAGAKKGRAPGWVTALRERGELAKHKVAS